jgi:quinol monooxygenase YgiN
MSKTTVHFNVNLAIHEGKLDAFQKIAETMIAGTQKEPGALAYEWHLSSDKTQCRVIETYADANAVQAHIDGPVVQQLVPRILENATLNGFEVYGDPGPIATEMLAGIGAKIFPLWRGLNR